MSCSSPYHLWQCVAYRTKMHYLLHQVIYWCTSNERDYDKVFPDLILISFQSLPGLTENANLFISALISDILDKHSNCLMIKSTTSDIYQFVSVSVQSNRLPCFCDLNNIYNEKGFIICEQFRTLLFFFRIMTQCAYNNSLVINYCFDVDTNNAGNRQVWWRDTQRNAKTDICYFRRSWHKSCELYLPKIYHEEDRNSVCLCIARKLLYPDFILFLKYKLHTIGRSLKSFYLLRKIV